MSDDTPVGAFTSAALAFFVWNAYVDWADRSFTQDKRPFISVNRFRAKYDPFEVESHDLTVNFMRVWEIQKEQKK